MLALTYFPSTGGWRPASHGLPGARFTLVRPKTDSKSELCDSANVDEALRSPRLLNEDFNGQDRIIEQSFEQIPE